MKKRSVLETEKPEVDPVLIMPKPETTVS